MNVDKGDMAIITGSKVNNGMIVTVIGPTPPREADGPMWEVEPVVPTRNLRGDLVTSGYVGDKFLRRINPPALDTIEDRELELSHE